MARTDRRAQTGQTEERRRLRIRPLYVLLAIILALFAFKFIQKTQEMRQLQAERAALQYQNQQTQQDNTAMQRRIRWYRTPQYVSEEARSVLGKTNPGDVSIMSQPQHPHPVIVRAAPVRHLAPAPPVWRQWWEAFFG
jgi:cell division protein FtsL